MSGIDRVSSAAGSGLTHPGSVRDEHADDRGFDLALGAAFLQVMPAPADSGEAVERATLRGDEAGGREESGCGASAASVTSGGRDAPGAGQGPVAAGPAAQFALDRLGGLVQRPADTKPGAMGVEKGRGESKHSAAEPEAVRALAGGQGLEPGASALRSGAVPIAAGGVPAGSGSVEAMRALASPGRDSAQERGSKGRSGTAPARVSDRAAADDAGADDAAGKKPVSDREAARLGAPWIAARGAGAPAGADAAIGAPSRATAAAPALAPTAARSASQVTLTFPGADGTEGTLRVSLRGPTLHATLIASDPAAAERLSADLGDLRRALVERGFVEPHLSVQASASSASGAAPAARAGKDHGPPEGREDAQRRPQGRDFDSSHGPPRRRAPRPGAER
jgi:hypothetical protein